MSRYWRGSELYISYLDQEQSFMNIHTIKHTPCIEHLASHFFKKLVSLNKNMGWWLFLQSRRPAMRYTLKQL